MKASHLELQWQIQSNGRRVAHQDQFSDGVFQNTDYQFYTCIPKNDCSTFLVLKEDTLRSNIVVSFVGGNAKEEDYREVVLDGREYLSLSLVSTCNDDSELSPGIIVAISLSCLVFVALSGTGVYCYQRRRKVDNNDDK